MTCQNFLANPVKKFFSRFDFATHDEFVHARLIDDDDFLLAAGGLQNRHLFEFVGNDVYMVQNDTVNIGQDLVTDMDMFPSSDYTEDLSIIVTTFLLMDRTSAIMEHFGIDKENEKLAKVSRYKSADGTSMTFAGKSIWGSIIDVACKRYGWTLHYVLWDISYGNLQLLLSDYIKTTYLSAKDRKKLHLSNSGEVIRADDKQALLKQINSQNWK